MQNTLVGLLEEQARARPQATAIAALDGTAITFDALLGSVQAIERRLRVAGLSPADRVAVALPNGPGMAIAILGVACAGACVPLDPALTTAEHRALLIRLRARATMVPEGTSSSARDASRDLGLVVLESKIDPRHAEVFVDAQAGPTGTSVSPRRVEPTDLALVLHTSGTTGKPKVVPLSHGNLCVSANNVADTLRLDPADRCLNMMPLFHVHGLVGALLASIASGGTAICAPGFDAATFLDRFLALQPTWYTAVPTLHHAVLAVLTPNREVLKHSKLRVVRSCSSALPPHLFRELESLLGVPVVEAYGMTEAAHQITSNPIDGGPRKPGSVGRPVGTEIRIVGAHGPGAAQSSRGEIAVRGRGVFEGYEGDSGARDGVLPGGWLMTGDEGYLDGDGYLFVCGRIKELINRGGEKIAPREIDEALAEHPAIAEAAAFAIPHPTLGEDVAVAVVPCPGAAISAGEVRAYLAPRLAEFKLPREVVVVGSLPRTPTGKLDRMSLAASISPERTVCTVSMPSDGERIVAEIFAAVLEVGSVGVEDNFFALGGDSLRANMVIGRLDRQFGVRLSVMSFFRAPTVRGVVAQLAGARSHAAPEISARAG